MRERLGEYELTRRIACGGMAEVFLAQRRGPEQFAKQVAIKRILASRARDAAMVEMFLDEARLVARFNHPNITQIFDLGEQEGSYFVAMEYIEGSTLAELHQRHLQQRRRMSVEVCARIASRVAEALHYAHDFRDKHGRALGIMHRDVSPQNIMISRAGAVKVIDFGIAKATVNFHRTQVKSLKGKVAYMSPEQIRQEMALDRRTDIFSLGIVLFQLLSGKHPFGNIAQQGTDMAMLNAIAGPEDIDPAALGSLPARLIAITIKALRKNREHRYASAREMQTDLEHFLLSRGVVTDSHALASLFQEADDWTSANELPPAVTHEALEVATGPTLPDLASPERLESVRATQGDTAPQPDALDVATVVSDAVPPPSRLRWAGLGLGVTLVSLLTGAILVSRSVPTSAPQALLLFTKQEPPPTATPSVDAPTRPQPQGAETLVAQLGAAASMLGSGPLRRVDDGSRQSPMSELPPAKPSAADDDVVVPFPNRKTTTQLSVAPDTEAIPLPDGEASTAAPAVKKFPAGKQSKTADKALGRRERQGGAKPGKARARRTTASGPATEQSLYKSGVAAVLGGDHSLGATQFQKCLQIDALSCRCYRGAGIAHAKKGDSRRGRRYYRAYLKFCPEAQDAGRVRQLLAGGGAPTVPGGEMNLPPVQEADDAPSFYRRGVTGVKTSLFLQAARDFKLCIRTDSTACRCYRGAGIVYAKMKDSRNSMRFYKEYLQRCPTAPDAAAVKQLLGGSTTRR